MVFSCKVIRITIGYKTKFLAQFSLCPIILEKHFSLISFLCFLYSILKFNKRFRIVGTTADVAIVAYGKSLQRLFAHAAEGLMYIISDPVRIERTEKREIKLLGTDYENLLVKWLSEILYFFEVKEFLGKEFSIYHLDEKHLHGVIVGEPYECNRHIIRTEVKAVTYHQLSLKSFKGKWKAKIILDL